MHWIFRNATELSEIKHEKKFSAFTIKAVSFFGDNIEGNQYRSKPKDLSGTIPELFEKA